MACPASLKAGQASSGLTKDWVFIMEWIRANWRSSLAALALSALLLDSSHSLAASLECPAALTIGQPACGVSRDVGSNPPESARSEHVGNPIDVVSGNKYQSEIDVRLGNSHLSLVRHYNSASAGQNLGLGNGWRHTYSVVLSTDGDEVRQIVQSDGRLINFLKSGDIWLAEYETDGHITQSPEGRHVWHLSDGRRLSFFGSFLTGISFSEGGTLSLFYRGSRLHSVTDEHGGALIFHYAPGVVGLPAYDPPEEYSAPGHLVRVVLPDGNQLSFGYSEAQNLVSVDYPRGTQGNLGRRYQYQDSLNKALLTERTNSDGQVFARWRYDELGRAISYRSGGSIRADGSETGPPDVMLEFSAGAASGAGITRVVFRKRSTRVYEWKLDQSGHVVELKRNDSDAEANVQPNDESQQIEQADPLPYKQHYPHDVLTVLDLDSLGYPSRVQHTLARDGNTHLLNTVYDQTGRLVDVNWQSGVLEDFNDGQTATIDFLNEYVAKNRAARTNLEVMFSAMVQKEFVEGTVAEFLEITSKELKVDSVVTGEELDEVWKSGSLDDHLFDTRQGYKVDGESQAETPCMDPLQDCASLLRTRDYAEVAECAYVTALCHTRFFEANLDELGLELGDVHEGSFHAEVFYDKERDEYIVTFAGTDFTSVGDWMNNLEQELGFSSFQYEKAAQLARLLVSNSPGANFSFVGHSLGGGLATAAAAAVGRGATVFNPAALDSESAAGLGVDYENAQNNTQIYSVNGEILSDVQTDIGFANLPPGTVHTLRRPEYNWIKDNIGQNPYTLYATRLGVALHGMGAVRQSLAELITRNQCV